ncbi:DUF4215 domain-containing protein [Sorangium sp. So ce1151]|uniref:DUF4215 domain-containing protein n=1 Tax=Sorangium sp. So ce1151 TaxID=3133332 RepID=UPI003F648D82
MLAGICAGGGPSSTERRAVPTATGPASIRAPCRDEYCGDGTTQVGLDEECDDGNNSAGDGCTPLRARGVSPER